MSESLYENNGLADGAESVPRLSRPAVPLSLTVPAYLEDYYHWAYLDPRNVRLLDRDSVVTTILWGNNKRLQRAAFGEFAPGERVLFAAHVYGGVVPNLAARLGPGGHLEAIDIAPIQVECCRKKLAPYPWARVRRGDARNPGGGPYDGVCSYFLLHEVPDDWKRNVVDGLLEVVRPGGKAVFMDYHEPAPWHPLKPLMSLILDRLEPFAKGLWAHEIEALAGECAHFEWRKETYFGHLYQKVVARRLSNAGPG